MAQTIFLCFPLLGLGQDHAVEGQVIDSLKNPIRLVHVMIFNADTFLAGAITDMDGNFRINDLKPASYILKIEALGFKDFLKKFAHQDGPTDLGGLRLDMASIELDGVELVAKRRLYDKNPNSVIINIGQIVANSGGSAFDVLRNTAGVSVNQQNGTLTLQGNGKVTIMVNGKASRIDGQALIGLLKSIPATNIENLEIFNNPPSKYEANGSGGMIDITTTVKNAEGQGGSLSLTSGYGKAEKTGVSSSFHSQNGKFGFYGSYSFDRNRSHEKWGLESEFDNPMSQKRISVVSNRKPVTTSHNYSFGTSYSVLKNTSLSGTVSGYNSKWDMLASDEVLRNDNSNVQEALNIETNEINQWNHISPNVQIEQSIGKSHSLIFDYNHLYYKDDNPSDYQIDSQMAGCFIEIQKTTPITFDVYNLDYRGKISEKLQLEAGVKTVSSNFNNDITVSSNIQDQTFVDNGLSNNTVMKEHIRAIYASFQWKLNGKTSLTSGLRFEDTNNELEVDSEPNRVTRKYGNLFPTASITHQIKDGSSLQANFSRRINRPSFNQLAPFALFLGPDALYSGNSNLQPALVNKYGVEWSWIGKRLTVQYLTAKEAIVEFQPRLSDNGQQYIFKAENMDMRNTLSISLGLPIRVAWWWQMENNISVQHESLKFDFQGTIYERNKGSLRTTISQQFVLGRKIDLELAGYYQSPTLFGISTFGSRGALNLGMRYQLDKQHGTLKLSFSNMLASDNWNIETNTLQPFVNTTETYFPEPRVLMVTYIKSFGGGKKENKYKRNGAEQEKKRLQ